VLLILLSPISSKTAQPGNSVYLQTVAPVGVGNQTVIPAGSYLQGVLDKVVRPGRLKGRAQIQMHFTSLTFPSGFVQAIGGSIGGAPADESATVKKEGTIQENGTRGRDAVGVATGSGSGAAIGALANGAKGAGIGAGIGAAAGLITVLLTRGDDVRLDVGDPIEMVMQRPLVLDHAESVAGAFAPIPARRVKSLSDREHPPYPVGYPYPGYPPIYWPRP
jgi:type IV secretion system protein VirB10